MRTFLSNPGTSINSIVNNQNQAPIARRPVSRRTVRRTLKRRKLVSRVSLRGSEILPENRKERLKFAKEHVNWVEADWSTIVFSDEVKLFPKRTVTRVLWSRGQDARCPPLEESLERKSINVWGYMRYDGIVELYRFEGTMNQGTYLDMMEEALENALLPRSKSGSSEIGKIFFPGPHRVPTYRPWRTNGRVSRMSYGSRGPISRLRKILGD